jgi:hypothetical protein
MKEYDYYTWTNNTFYNLDEALNCVNSLDSSEEILLFILNINSSSRRIFIEYFDSYSFMQLKENRVVVTFINDLDLGLHSEHVSSVKKRYNINDISKYYILNKKGEIIQSEPIPIWLSYELKNDI